jgi:hypothetical protein
MLTLINAKVNLLLLIFKLIILDPFFRPKWLVTFVFVGRLAFQAFGSKISR